MCFKSVRKDNFNFNFNRKPKFIIRIIIKLNTLFFGQLLSLDYFYSSITKCVSRACIIQSYSVFNLAMSILSFEDSSGWSTEVGVA